jgi:hypothetical protein
VAVVERIVARLGGPVSGCVIAILAFWTYSRDVATAEAHTRRAQKRDTPQAIQPAVQEANT